MNSDKCNSEFREENSLEFPRLESYTQIQPIRQTFPPLAALNAD